MHLSMKVDLAEKRSTVDQRWPPKIVARCNGNDAMVVKVEGAFFRHVHPETDDFFLVLSGALEIELRDRTVALGPGELFVVPAGVEHRPVARGESHLLLIEPAGTPNTGDPATAAAKTAI